MLSHHFARVLDFVNSIRRKFSLLTQIFSARDAARHAPCSAEASSGIDASSRGRTLHRGAVVRRAPGAPSRVLDDATGASIARARRWPSRWWGAVARCRTALLLRITRDVENLRVSRESRKFRLVPEERRAVVQPAARLSAALLEAPPRAVLRYARMKIDPTPQRRPHAHVARLLVDP